MDYLIIIVISYLLGSIPFGLLLTKLFLKKDIREIGSGNIGATNVLRLGNKFIGYSTLLLDIFKAILPVIYIKFNYPDFIYISALSVFLDFEIKFSFLTTQGLFISSIQKSASFPIDKFPLFIFKIFDGLEVNNFII